jgi:hypothetical protein
LGAGEGDLDLAGEEGPMSAGIDWPRLIRERPERIDRATVLATPSGGAMIDRDSWFPSQDPLRVDVYGTDLSYLRWNDGSGVAYVRSDLVLHNDESLQAKRDAR